MLVQPQFAFCLITFLALLFFSNLITIVIVLCQLRLVLPFSSTAVRFPILLDLFDVIINFVQRRRRANPVEFVSQLFEETESVIGGPGIKACDLYTASERRFHVLILGVLQNTKVNCLQQVCATNDLVLSLLVQRREDLRPSTRNDALTQDALLP